MSRTISEALFELLQSGRLSMFLALLWAVHVWGSIWYLAPGPDDGASIAQAFGFIHRGDLGLLYMDDYRESFVNLPGYAFAQAIFFKAWTSLGLSINVYTYRTFSLLVVSFVLVCGAILLARLGPVAVASRNLRVNTFLILLGVSPVVIDILFQRPEALGLLATVAALITYDMGYAGVWRPNWGLYSSAFALGFAATTHPTFILTSAGIAVLALGQLLMAKRHADAILATIVGLVPTLGVIAWFAAHAPASWDTLLLYGESRTPKIQHLGDSFVLMFRFALFGYSESGSVATNAFYALLFSMLIIITALSATLIFSWFRVRESNPISQRHSLVLAFFAAALLNSLIVETATFQVYTVYAFAAVLTVASFLTQRRTSGTSSI